MNKTKKFLHMIISFAFAFVLAIGGIGIKSAKVAKADLIDGSSFASCVAADMTDVAMGPFEGLEVVIIESTFIPNFTNGKKVELLIDNQFLSTFILEVAEDKGLEPSLGRSLYNALQQYVKIFVYNAGVYTDILNYHGGTYTSLDGSNDNQQFVTPATLLSAIVQWPMDGDLYSLLSGWQSARGGEFLDLRTYVYPQNGLITATGDFWVKEFDSQENLLRTKQIPSAN